MTARDLCTAALSYLNVIADGETPEASDMNRVFADLNDLVDSWTTDERLIFSENDEQFTLSPGQASYTVGPTGNFATVRPGGIQWAWIRRNGVDYPMVSLNNQEYNEIGLKAIQITIPKYFYFNPTFPNATLFIWPVPSEALVINLTSLKQFVRFATLDTAVSLPVGYTRALKWNLIKEVAEVFGKQISDSTNKKAAESKATLQRLNAPPLRMHFDQAITNYRGRGYSIYRDGDR